MGAVSSQQRASVPRVVPGKIAQQAVPELQPLLQRRERNVLIERVRAVAFRAQTVEGGNAERRGEVAVAAATGEWHFVEIEAGRTRDALRTREQALHMRAAFE